MQGTVHSSDNFPMWFLERGPTQSIEEAKIFIRRLKPLPAGGFHRAWANEKIRRNEDPTLDVPPRKQAARLWQRSGGSYRTRRGPGLKQEIVRGIHTTGREMRNPAYHSYRSILPSSGRSSTQLLWYVAKMHLNSISFRLDVKKQEEPPNNSTPAAADRHPVRPIPSQYGVGATLNDRNDENPRTAVHKCFTKPCSSRAEELPAWSTRCRGCCTRP